MKSKLFKLMWQFVKQTGFSKSEALKIAWRNLKLEKSMRIGIVKFYFQKVDGTIREAWGTTNSNIIPATDGNRTYTNTVKVYFDTEKQAWRSFKKINLK